MTACSEKQCNRCKEVKLASFFYKHKRMKDGLFGHCIECHKSYGKKWNEANKSSRTEILRRSHLLRTYGVSAEEYDRLREAQSYNCKICGIHESKACHGRLCVDHCHDSGEVRGLLCKKCNSAIGLLGDNVSNLASAIEYLTQSSPF